MNRVLYIILDDDPTGMQTVHDCSIFTNWKKETLKLGFIDNRDFFFILTNTRASNAAEVKNIISEAVSNLLELNKIYKRNLVFLLRSDSTLRGHFPLELNTLKNLLPHNCDGIVFVPAFFEGNRITRNNIHYIREGKKLTPCDQSEFSEDSVFPYRTSHLPSYIEEKTGGQIKRESVQSIDRMILQDRETLNDSLKNINNGSYLIVNSESYDDLDRFTVALRESITEGKQWIIQCAASLVKSLTQTPDQLFIGSESVHRPGPGLILVGSHVNKTTKQLIKLLENPDLGPLEISVRKILLNIEKISKDTRVKMKELVNRGKTPAIYTSREELQFSNIEERLDAGNVISAFLWGLVRDLEYRPSFILSKGGITSHDVLTKGLATSHAIVAGQAAKGVPVIIMPEDHDLAGMPLIIFPGNVGDDNTVLEVYRAFQKGRTE
ncbi:MAG: hypothetical protein PF518_11605 [Spirochaetaceae bacterium]|jgi:uncharacterized protein YgbK (DUF1537 family)|nr:hypothetical protein [Spirochaetaceae bacterium]